MWSLLGLADARRLADELLQQALDTLDGLDNSARLAASPASSFIAASDRPDPAHHMPAYPLLETINDPADLRRLERRTCTGSPTSCAPSSSNPSPGPVATCRRTSARSS